MTTALAPTPVLGLRDAVSAYLATDFSGFDADGLIEVLRDTETELRRIVAGQHAVMPRCAPPPCQRLALHAHNAT